MKEFRITDGKTIIIETARVEYIAILAAAKRLECSESALTILSIKNRPVGCHRAGRKEDVTSVLYHKSQ